MAEYITKEQIIGILYAPRKATLTFEDFVKLIGNLTPADVIERSKIDKAIEEIKEVSFKHNFEQGEYIGEITKQWEVVKLDHVLKILERNIGE